MQEMTPWREPKAINNIYLISLKVTFLWLAQIVFTPAMNLFSVQLQPAQRRSLSIRPRSSSLVPVHAQNGSTRLKAAGTIIIQSTKAHKTNALEKRQNRENVAIADMMQKRKNKTYESTREMQKKKKKTAVKPETHKPLKNDRKRETLQIHQTNGKYARWLRGHDLRSLQRGDISYANLFRFYNMILRKVTAECLK